VRRWNKPVTGCLIGMNPEEKIPATGSLPASIWSIESFKNITMNFHVLDDCSL
jgi:hypothetical protein